MMNFFYSRETGVKNILGLSVIAFFTAVQLWLIIVMLIWATPPANVLAKLVYPEWWHMLHPEREAAVYRGFIVSVLSLQVLLLWFARHRIHEAQCWQQVKKLLMVDALCCVLMLAAVFKVVLYAPRGQLAKNVLVSLALMALAYKITWPWVLRLWPLFVKRCSSMISLLKKGLWIDLLVALVIFSLLYINDTAAVAARIFLGEQFHHYDSAVASSAWAFLSGLKLNIDVISQYGLGLPIAVGLLTKCLGGFSYASSLTVLMLGAIVYFICTYLLLRLWLKDRVLSVAATLLSIAAQMFHAGAYPIAFTYPSTTVWRFYFDVFFFLCIYGHATTGRALWLALAGITVGTAIFHMTTTGLCLGLALLVYLVVNMLMRYRQRLTLRLGQYALSLACAGCALAFLLLIFIGPSALSSEFWQNMNEFNQYFLSGFGVEPMDSPLRQHQLFAGLLGFAIPLILMGGVLLLGSALLAGTLDAAGSIALVMSSYGILLFHYYISRSVAANVFVVALPCIFLCFFWLACLTRDLPSAWYQRVRLGLLAICAYALVTSHQFTAYPNLFNFSKKPMIDPLVFAPLPDGRSYFNHLYSQLPMDGRLPFNSLGEQEEQSKTEKDFIDTAALKNYYAQEFDFKNDAGLIDQLVPVGGKAAIISSFETQLLIQANRKPFFYYTPLVISRLLRMRTFPVTALYTSGHVQRTLAQIDKEKPTFIFIERIFSRENIDLATYQDASAFLALMRYIHGRYEPYATGEFLMALKLKGQ